jgi:hypothetical protein
MRRLWKWQASGCAHVSKAKDTATTEATVAIFLNGKGRAMWLSNWQIFGLGVVIGMYLLASLAGIAFVLTGKADKVIDEVLSNDK